MTETVQTPRFGEFSEGLVIVISALLSGFYVLQKTRGKCGLEVIYVSAVTTLVYSSKVLAGKSFTWVTLEDGNQVPLGRYFSWLLTCPVLLIQITSVFKLAGNTINTNQLTLLIILDQILIVFGSYAALSSDETKWVFFIVALTMGISLFASVIFLFFESYPSFPDSTKPAIVAWGVLYLLSWGINPIIWVLGSPGLGKISQDMDIGITSIMDILSKNIFGLLGWYIRWVALDGEKDSKGRLIKINNEKFAKSMVNTTMNNKHLGLDYEDFLAAKTDHYTVLFLDQNILAIKCMQLIAKNIGMKLYVADNVTVAKATMALLPVSKFDAVIVVPKHHTVNELKNLREFSEFIVQPPYKIPMLGVYFDLDDRSEEPGYYIHGIIPRPLDEEALKASLLEWRLTAKLWRKVAESVEALGKPTVGNTATKPEKAIENKVVDRKQATMDRKSGALFASQIFPTIPTTSQEKGIQSPTNTSANVRPINQSAPTVPHTSGTRGQNTQQRQVNFHF